LVHPAATTVHPAATQVAPVVPAPGAPYRKPVTAATTAQGTLSGTPAPVTTTTGFASDLIHVTVESPDAGLLGLSADAPVVR